MTSSNHFNDDRPHLTGRTMHDRLEDPYCDPICCCEAEPRWQRLAEELERTAPAPLPEPNPAVPATSNAGGF